MRITTLCGLLVFFFVAVTAFTQTETYELTGAIDSYDGALLSGATVTLTGTGINYTSVTGSDGTFAFRALPPGTYTVKAELDGFRTEQVTVLLDRNRKAFVSMAASPLPDEVTVLSVSDAASGRPQFLPYSEVSRGGIFTAYGNFPGVPLTSAPSLPLPTDLAGLTATIGNGTVSNPVQFTFVSPSQISGVMPSATPSGINNLVVRIGSRQSKPFRIKVVDARPTFFTLNQSGGGTAVITDPQYSVITNGNPARLGGDYVAWLTNLGPSPKDGDFAVEDKRQSLFDLGVYIGGVKLQASDVQFLGVAGHNYGQMNFHLPPNIPTGCSVPMKIVTTPAAGAQPLLSNLVTIPISGTPGAACSDLFGFTASEIDTLAKGGQFDQASVFTTEVSNFTKSGRSERFVSFLQGRRFDQSTSLTLPPSGSCVYSWEPQGYANPFAAKPIVLGGTATQRLPFTTLVYGPSSNNGPYSFLFSPPAAYTEGPITFTYDSGFMAGGQPFTATFGSTYARSAGLASRAVPTSVYDESSLDQLIEALGARITGLPSGGRRLAVQFQVLVDDATRGRHLIGCLGDPAAPAFLDHAQHLLTLVPPNPVRADAVLRFFPEQPLRFPHPGGAFDWTDLVFDGVDVFTNFNQR